MRKLKDIRLELPLIDLKRLKSADNEDPFMFAAVELAKSLGLVSIAISCIAPLNETTHEPRHLFRHEAVLAGNLVRISKLHSKMIGLICDKDMDTAMIILRCLGENLITLRFLLKNYNEDCIREYMEYSLQTEKELLDKIESAISVRGHALPIEERMKKSILSAFQKSGIDAINYSPKKPKTWEKSPYARAKSLGMEEEYFSICSLPSHSVHGNWQDLLTNHLESVDDMFIPKTERTYPRPQPLLGISLFLATVDIEYLWRVIPESEDRKRVEDHLTKLFDLVKDVNDIHEDYIQKRRKSKS